MVSAALGFLKSSLPSPLSPMLSMLTNQMAAPSAPHAPPHKPIPPASPATIVACRSDMPAFCASRAAQLTGATGAFSRLWESVDSMSRSAIGAKRPALRKQPMLPPLIRK